jgi:GTP-binding protein
LATRPQIVVLNKIDLSEAQDRWQSLRTQAEQAGYPVFAISAVAQQGTRELMAFAARKLAEIKEEEAERAAVHAIADMQGPVLRPKPEDAFTVTKERGVFILRGKRIERLVNMTNLESEEGVTRLFLQLEKMGVNKELEYAGVQAGDTVRCGKTEFLWGE